MSVVAAVQFCPVFKDYRGNLTRLTSLVVQAARKGAWLIVCPELATTGYSFMSETEARPFSEDVHARQGSVQVMLGLANTLKVSIAWGLVGLDPGTGNLFNTQVLVTPEAELVTYAKINRWGQDYCWAKAGRANPPILKITHQDRTHKVGLLVCRDVRDKVNDDWNSLYTAGDADIVALSSNFGKSSFPATPWMTFAEDNKTTLVVSNRYGQEANNDFGSGGICVIRPSGEVVCDGLVWNQDCIVYAEV